MGYSDLSNSFVYKKPLLRSKLDQLTENDKFIKDNGWQTGTKAVFYQVAVPTGWAQDSSQNNKALRVVSGAGGGSGGSQLLSATLSIAHTTHTIPTQAAHDHTVDSHDHDLESGSSNRDTGGATLLAIDDSGFLRYSLSEGGPSFNTKGKTIKQDSQFTLGSNGSHNHGGVVSNSALTDINFSYVDVLFASKSATGGFTYTDLTGQFTHNDKLDFDPFPELAENDQYNNDRLTPAGTIMVFVQASQPSGWSQLTTQNGKALRIVSGAGGGGAGSFDISSQLTLSHNHSITSFVMPGHTIPNHIHTLETIGSIGATLPSGSDFMTIDGSNFLRNVILSGPTATRTIARVQTVLGGSGGITGDDSLAHVHGISSSLSDVTLNFINVIQCSKNSTGAPFPYVDLTPIGKGYQYKKLASNQRLNNLGKNDEYLQFHTVEATSRAIFYQATAPLNWTQIVSLNDYALRIVSGAGGGSGGTVGFSQTLSLSHIHTIANYAHAHNVNAGTPHQHILATGSQTANAPGGTNGMKSFGGAMQLVANTGSNDTEKATSGNPLNGGSSLNNHDHGVNLGSALSDVNLAYVDTIQAEKN